MDDTFPTTDRAMPDPETILETLAAHLSRHPEILFAYAHGSLVDGVPIYRDVDVAVYVDPAWAQGRDLFAYEMDLAVRLTVDLHREIGLRVPVDIQILNRAPLLFRMHVIRDGRLLFARDEAALADFVEATARHHMDMESLLRVYRESLAP